MNFRICVRSLSVSSKVQNSKYITSMEGATPQRRNASVSLIFFFLNRNNSALRGMHLIQISRLKSPMEKISSILRSQNVNDPRSANANTKLNAFRFVFVSSIHIVQAFLGRAIATLNFERRSNCDASAIEEGTIRLLSRCQRFLFVQNATWCERAQCLVYVEFFIRQQTPSTQIHTQHGRENTRCCVLTVWWGRR